MPPPEPEPKSESKSGPVSPEPTEAVASEPAPEQREASRVDLEDSKEADKEPTAAEQLEAPARSDGGESVQWMEAASETRELRQEEVPSPAVDEEPPAAPAAESVIEAPAPAPEEPPLESVAASAEETAIHSEDTAAPANEEPTVAPPSDGERPPQNRPRFRVGEVPVYDEDDFLTELKRELSKCKRVDRPLTLILIQISDLEQIVELFGRNYRESVLWHVAEQAMASLREVDLVGMMSSKDFVAMTAFASDRYGGGRIVSRMKSAVRKTPFRVGEELPSIIPALRFGMATFPQDGDDVPGLMKKAETELSAE
jgi:diguanylate cyclase (GGDEF)-like protein